MESRIRRLQVLSEEELRSLLQCLDDAGLGRVSYRSFRTAVAEFLAKSRDFHSALSPEEFNAILYRIKARVKENGLTVGQALREADGRSALPGAEFMQSLRGLRLGLSNKEVAQIFNSLSADSFRMAGTAAPNPVHDGQVSIALFDTLVENCSNESLKDWATVAFPRLHELIVSKAVDGTVRRHADPPLRHYLPFAGFSTLMTEVDASVSSAEVSRLWCVLEKDDFADEPLVKVEEVLRWMKVPAKVRSGKVSHPDAGLIT
ncbi:unnamed protein product [Effrenium voratum]|nr:unnamed protein product [Effrenium voratum]